MPTSWGKGYLTPSLSIIVHLEERNMRGCSCSLHLSKQAAILEPGQLDDLLEILKNGRPKLTASGIHVHATVTGQSIILKSVTLDLESLDGHL